MTLLPRPKLDSVLAGLPRVSVHGPWTRVVALKHLLGTSPDILYAKGAPTHGARYTPKGGMDSIYLASDPVTALVEVQAVFLHPSAPAFTMKTPPWTLIPVDGVVTDAVDLCDAANQAALNTSFQELTGDWVVSQANFLAGTGPQPATQILGQVAFDSKMIVGLQYPSAKNPGGRNLVVFRNRLAPGGASWLEVAPPLAARLP